MTIERALQELKEGTCYECAYGCESTATCGANDCALSVAVNKAIKALEFINHLQKEFEPHNMVCVGDLVEKIGGAE